MALYRARQAAAECFIESSMDATRRAVERNALHFPPSRARSAGDLDGGLATPFGRTAALGNLPPADYAKPVLRNAEPTRIK